MKGIKIAIAALLAAVAISIWVAPASAESTVLCKVNEAKCQEKNLHSLGFVGGLGKAFPGSSMEIVLSAGTVKCPEGKLGPFSFKKTAGALTGTMAFWWSFECTPSPCKVEVLETGYAAELLATGGGNGALSVVVPNLLVNCSLSLTCYYSQTPIAFTVEGGNPGVITSAATLVLSSGGAGCGELALLKAKYILTAEPLYVTLG